MKRAQIAMEFIMFTIVAVFIVIGLLALGLHLSVDKLKEQRFEELNTLADSLQEEVLLAAQMSYGYHRQFAVPMQVKGGSYELSNTANYLWVSAHGYNISRDLPPVTGNFRKGINIISNQGGVVIEQ